MDYEIWSATDLVRDFALGLIYRFEIRNADGSLRHDMCRQDHIQAMFNKSPDRIHFDQYEPPMLPFSFRYPKTKP